MITTRHKVAAKNVGKYRTDKDALVKSNYSESYAESGHIKKTAGWQQLMEKALPDSQLLKVHKEGLKATRIHNSLTSPDMVVPDYAVRHKYLETGYKLKGKTAGNPEEGQRPQPIIGIQVNVSVDNGDKQNSDPTETDQGSAGRDISV